MVSSVVQSTCNRPKPRSVLLEKDSLIKGAVTPYSGAPLQRINNVRRQPDWKKLENRGTNVSGADINRTT